MYCKTFNNRRGIAIFLKNFMKLFEVVAHATRKKYLSRIVQTPEHVREVESYTCTRCQNSCLVRRLATPKKSKKQFGKQIDFCWISEISFSLIWCGFGGHTAKPTSKLDSSSNVAADTSISEKFLCLDSWRMFWFFSYRF